LAEALAQRRGRARRRRAHGAAPAPPRLESLRAGPRLRTVLAAGPRSA